MRFLLHAAKKSKSSAARSSVKKTTARATSLHHENSNSENSITASRQWGQQCSPNCGCVVRFESTVDENTTIVSASYHAKQLLVSHENGTIRPHLTTNHAKPLLTECKCTTLHSLSQAVISHLEGRRLDQIKNSLIGGASPAVVHASLKTQKLPTSHSHCFSLMQQAVVAMTCGYLPKSVPEKTYQQYLYERYSPHVYESEEVGYGVDENSGISVGASAVDIFDMHVEEEEQQEEEEKEKEMKTTKLTWETYVDELYHQYDDDSGGVEQWSA